MYSLNCVKKLSYSGIKRFLLYDLCFRSGTILQTEPEQRKEQTSLHIDMHPIRFGTSIFLIPLTTDVWDLSIH